MKRHWLAIVGVVLIAVAGLCGCRSGQLLQDISIRPATISPNADGVEDVAEIHYTLMRQSQVTIYLVGPDGERHVFRDNKRRSPGDRTAYFGGVIDGHMLPDGVYTCVFEAVDERGRTATGEAQITLVDADTEYLTIDSLAVYPEVFTPNRDGITDRVTVGYNLNKEAESVDVYLLDDEGNKYPVPEDKIRELGSVGPHEHDYDAGVDLGAPPPDDAEYRVVVEAVDAVGNTAREEARLRIEGGGVPRVEIVNSAAKWNTTVVPLGQTLTFTCTVKNVGLVPVRTKGPESGTTYSTSQNFNTLEEYEEPGVFRVGLDFEGNSSGRTYPYRWQLGTDDELTKVDTNIGEATYLMPGQSATVIGHLRIDDKPSLAEPYYWIGLMHEQVEIVQDQVEPIAVSIGY